MTERRAASGDPKRVLVALGVLLAVAAVAVTLFFVDPRGSLILPPCPFYWLTGLWCPGCGSGRAIHALVHGDMLTAIDYNPLMVASLPFLAYAGVSGLLVSFGRKGLPRMFNGRYWGWFVVCLVFAYWIVRNIPVYPFSLLAP